MTTYVGADGTKFDDEDLERWAEEAEEGFPNWRFGKPVMGRPVSVGSDAKPITVRLDTGRRAKLDEVARQRNISNSQLIRDLIDAL
ncbi:CopG family transcriptional regulator [Actinomycetaceae bacterium MB13-C1-2]|nr:CopG family transcriptional regulator [Actinomycetaceae bacterium MB13-C1-2]